jgi:hypothetical protein
LIEDVKYESSKNWPINNMVIRFGSNKKHVGFIFCFYRYKTHEMCGDIYSEKQGTDLSYSLNEHIDE